MYKQFPNMLLGNYLAFRFLRTESKHLTASVILQWAVNVTIVKVKFQSFWYCVRLHTFLNLTCELGIAKSIFETRFIDWILNRLGIPFFLTLGFCFFSQKNGCHKTSKAINSYLLSYIWWEPYKRRLFSTYLVVFNTR